MKIGIDARMYGQSVTGIGIYTKNLIDHLLEIDNKNEYVIFLLPKNYDEFSIDKKNVKKVKVNIHWYNWAEQLILPFLILKENIDLMHFPHFNVPILYPKKFIATIHDITPRFFPGHLRKKSNIKKLGYWLIFNVGIRRAKKIISVSQHTKNQIIKFYKLNQSKIEVIHNGIDKNLQQVKDYGIINKLKAKYNITKPYIFYVGVWRDHKNLPNLVKAFYILIIDYKLNISLVLGGTDDPNYPQTSQTIKKLKIEKQVIRPGFIADNELPIFYSAAEIFVLPSHNEGFGLVAIEALACNTPVVASKTTSLPEVLSNGALYFNPDNVKEMANVINKVITNKEISKNLVKTGREVIQKYNWKTTAQKTLNIYDQVSKK